MKKLLLLSIVICLMFCYAATAQEYRIEGNEVKITKEIKFKTGAAELLPESDDALQIIKKYLTDKSYISLMRIEVHSDNTGSEKSNQLITEKRAIAICKKLVAMGVDCKRLLPVGFGSSKPVAGNDSEEGRAQNRRVNFINAALRGKAIGGMPTDGGGVIAGEICN